MSASAPGITPDLFTTVNGSISASGDGAFVQNRQTWQYSDAISIVEGKHTVTLGGDYRREASNRVEDYATDPSFNFNGQYSGSALMDLLLGLPNNYNQQSEVQSRLRPNGVDAFAQDNYKIVPSLTIDAGIRWEPFLPPVDNLNDQICFDPSLQSESTFYPNAPAGITFPGPPVGQGGLGKGDAGCPRSGLPNRYKNFAPRIGFNADPFKNGKTSIRAGYGIFYDQARLIAWNRFSTAQPFDANTTINGPSVLTPSLSGNNIFANSGRVDQFPFVIPRTPAARAAYAWPIQSAETVFAPNFNEGYTQQYNFTVDQQVAKAYTLTLSYIGNKGTHLFISRETNYAPLGSYVHNTPTNPTTGLPYDPITYNNQDSVLASRRRFSGVQCPIAGSTTTGPCYGPVEELDPSGYSNFNSLQITLNRRLDHNFSIRGRTCTRSTWTSSPTRPKAGMVRAIRRTSRRTTGHRTMMCAIASWPRTSTSSRDCSIRMRCCRGLPVAGRTRRSSPRRPVRRTRSTRVWTRRRPVLVAICGSGSWCQLKASSSWSQVVLQHRGFRERSTRHDWGDQS